MGQKTTLTMAAAVTALTASAAFAGPQQTLVHTNQILLGAEFNETSGYGDNPLSITFDGNNAYVGGYNNGPVSPGTIGVVKVLNVTGAAPSTQLLANSLISSPDLRGFDALAYDAASDSIFTFHDSGVFLTSLISRRSVTDGSEVWTTTSPANQRVMAGAIDPTGDAGSPAVAFLAQGQGRRLALKVSDGSILYDASGGSNPGGIILGEKNATDDFGTAWRALTFDASGNIAVTEQDYFGYGTRIADNQWQSLDSVANRISKSVEDDGAINFAGQGIAILPGLGVDGADLLAFSGRGMSQTTDLDGNITAVSNTQVHLRNIDGSTTGLSQIALTGGEDSIGADWLNNTKNLAFGLDGSGTPTLLVLDFIEKRLDVYQIQTASLAGDLNDDGFVGIADLNIVLGVWNQNVTPGDKLQGDPSGDGFVGIDDLNEVLGNWNNGTPPAAAAVPEPTTLALLGLGTLAALRRKH
jgi:hypothetical protein